MAKRTERLNTETLIEESKKVHTSELDNLSYEKTEYTKYHAKVIVTCHNKDKDGNEHGDFSISVGHLLSGQGCPKCRYLKVSRTKCRPLEKVIALAREVHGDKYDYSLISENKGDRVKNPIICKKHGVFYQSFNNHIAFKEGCPICGRERCDEARRMTFAEFLEKARKRHGDKYDYKEEDFTTVGKMRMFCKEHGEFWQSTANHLYGQGCPTCRESRLEKEIRVYLSELGEEYVQQYSPEWLGRQSLDFYLPKYNTAIECQGKQHFLEDCGWGNKHDDKDSLEIITERDTKKRNLCEEHGVKLLYFSNLGIEYPYEVFEDKEKLFEEIKKNENKELITELENKN